MLIIVTDGEDNTSKYSLAEALEVAKRSSAIYAIGLLARRLRNRRSGRGTRCWR